MKILLKFSYSFYLRYSNFHPFFVLLSKHEKLNKKYRKLLKLDLLSLFSIEAFALLKEDDLMLSAIIKAPENRIQMIESARFGFRAAKRIL